MSVGVDASIALRFHLLRERNPALFASQWVNKLWYAAVGGGESLKRSGRKLAELLELWIDGEKVEIGDAVGVTLLNIPYYAGGGLPLGEKSPDFCYGDGRLEVIGFRNLLHCATTRAGLSRAYRIGGGKHIMMRLRGVCAMQVDGEPWEQRSCEMEVLYRGQAPMLMQAWSEGEKAMSTVMECLEWARSTGVITGKQKEVIMEEYRRRRREEWCVC